MLGGKRYSGPTFSVSGKWIKVYYNAQINRELKYKILSLILRAFFKDDCILHNVEEHYTKKSYITNSVKDGGRITLSGRCGSYPVHLKAQKSGWLFTLPNKKEK